MSANKMWSGVLAASLACGCAAAGAGPVSSLLPGVSSLQVKSQTILESAPPTDLVLTSADGKGLATAANLGATSEYILDMPTVEARLNALLAPLVAQWPHPLPAPPRVKIALGAQYSAVTFADGVIVIEAGALDDVQGTAVDNLAITAGYVQSDPELQYLLGHEFSHYALSHHKKSDMMSKVRSSAANAAAANNAVATLTHMQYQKTAKGGEFVVTDKKGLTKNVGDALDKLDTFNVYSRIAFSPAWGRSQEDDADALSFDLMNKAGLHGNFYDDVFKKLKKQEDLTQRAVHSLEASYEDTKSTYLNEKTMQSLMDGKPVTVSDNIIGDLADQSFKRMRAGANDYFSQSHRSPEVRNKGMKDYESKHYPDLDPFDTTARTDSVLKEIRSDPAFKDAKVATIAYFDATAAHHDDKKKEAEAAIGRALATRYGKEASILYLGGRIAEAGGNGNLAMARYAAATQDPSANPETYRQLARLQIDRRQYTEKAATVKLGIERLKDSDFFLPSDIYEAVKRKETDKAVNLVVACRDTKREDLAPACEAAFAGLDSQKLTDKQKAALEKKSLAESANPLNIYRKITGDTSKQK